MSGRQFHPPGVRSLADLVTFRSLHARLDHHARVEQLCEHLGEQRLPDLRLDEHEPVGRDCCGKVNIEKLNTKVSWARTVDVVLEKVEQARRKSERRGAELVNSSIRSDSAQAGAEKQELARSLGGKGIKPNSPVAVVVGDHD